MKKNEFMPIEKYYGLKSIFEKVWGKDTYLDLKHCSDLKVWKRYAERTLKASKLAIETTILVKDDYWQKGVDDIVMHGVERVKSANDFDDLFQALSASYIELSFHQIGLMPTRSSNFRAQLRKDYWKLDPYRSVQYVQNLEQKNDVEDRIERIKRAKGQS